MTSEILAEIVLSIWAALLAIALDWVPGLREWWDALVATQKRLFMLVFIVAFGVLYFVGGCYSLLGLIGLEPVTCDAPGAFIVVKAILLAIGVNQGVHLLTKNTQV